MKKYIYYIIFSALLLTIHQVGFADIINIPHSSDIEDVSVEYKDGFGWSSIVDSINVLGFWILSTLKIILAWVLLIYIVYIWIQMIISMWTDEEALSAAKRQFAYILVALVFINIPGTLFEAFYNPNGTQIGELSGTWNDSSLDGNIFFNSAAFTNTLTSIIGFLEVLIFIVAIATLVFAGIRLIFAGKDEETRSNVIRRITWSIAALIFVGFIEAWKSVTISWSIPELTGLFGNIINILLFWVVPIAMLFLTLAGYYYITSNGDEERVKKAKNIVVYTVIATILLLSVYTFLLDLANLF